MRKIFILISTTLFLVSFHTAYADGGGISVTSGVAVPTQTVTVELLLSDNPGIIAGLFEIEYDRERLELISVKDKALLPGGVFSPSFEKYPYILLWNSASSKNFTSDGVLAELSFRVLEDAKGGNAFINISYKKGDVFDAELNDVDLNISNGAIYIEGESVQESEENTGENTDNELSGEKIPDNESSNDEKQDDTTHVSGNSSHVYHGNTISATTAPKDAQDNSANEENEVINGNTSDTVIISFEDVDENMWYYDVVKYAVEKKLMNGISNTIFAPDELLTRAMLVTVLYRNEGEPEKGFSASFEDVYADDYYADSVVWAKSEGIVNGVSESEFMPNANITREQIAAVMYRYARYKGYDTSDKDNTNILSYEDFAEISDYAIESMQYAVGSGLMKGKTQTALNPGDYATRAETAAILCRFMIANK